MAQQQISINLAIRPLRWHLFCAVIRPASLKAIPAQAWLWIIVNSLLNLRFFIRSWGEGVLNLVYSSFCNQCHWWLSLWLVGLWWVGVFPTDKIQEFFFFFLTTGCIVGNVVWLHPVALAPPLLHGPYWCSASMRTRTQTVNHLCILKWVP